MDDRLPDFGDYVMIEQKRYGVPNENYIYKVVGNLRSNTYRRVPVDMAEREPIRGEIVPVVRAIRCGVDETRVETFRVSDVQLEE